MKLIIAIVHERDKHRLADTLNQKGITFTKLGSTGGFLRQGNFTLLVGVEDHQVDSVLEIINDSCGTCERYVNVPPESMPPLTMGAIPPQPVTAEAGGAVAFVLNIERFERF
jgi:uncharacterized protein YaaQ